jgi:hypothetical protein
MSEERKIEEFYVRRINWLVSLGRSDLVDEIADDSERRRVLPQPAPVEAGTRRAVASLQRQRQLGRS